MRKLLRSKFWSQGTKMGYMGPGSQKALNQGFSKYQFLVIWGPYNLPVIVAFQVQAKNPNFICIVMCTNSTPQYRKFTIRVLGGQN